MHVEYTFELAWKMLKDYLEDGGVNVKPTRHSITTARRKCWTMALP